MGKKKLHVFNVGFSLNSCFDFEGQMCYWQCLGHSNAVIYYTITHILILDGDGPPLKHQQVSLPVNVIEKAQI